MCVRFLSPVRLLIPPAGWTLQNFSSIKEQQVGGWTQAGCHGTGAALPPVDETVVSLRLVTPAKGTLFLDAATNPRLFALAKVGLGCLGVVAEVTLQGVRAHALAEHTQLMSHSAVLRGHAARLGAHRHVRYMWLPYTEACVVVTADPLESCPPGTATTVLPHEAERTASLRSLVARAHPQLAADRGASFADLRAAALAANPLSAAHVADVNAAEAAFWAASAGWRVGTSEDILGFECGGEQEVAEAAVPCGTRRRPSGADVAFAADTLALIRSRGIPAPAPLEQRWSCGSSAPMSPAFAAPAPGDALFSWLGIIMYLPPPGPSRAAVQASFAAYKRDWLALGDKYGASQHWAKIEAPRSEAELMALRATLRARFPVADFNAARAELDPHNVLGNEAVDALLPRFRGGAHAVPQP